MAEENDNVQPEGLAEDIARIEPRPADDPVLELSNGMRVKLNPLKTFELFSLLRIVTRGAGSRLGTLRFDQGEDAFLTQFMALMLLAFPESDVEVVEFTRRMIRPVDLLEGKTREAKTHNDALWEKLNAELSNPEPEDLLSIMEKVIEVEGKDIQGLGKRLMSMVQNAANLRN